MERPNLIRAMGAGALATIVMTLALFFTPLVNAGGGFFPMIGSIGPMGDMAATEYAAFWGIVWHANIGVILYPNLYILAAYPILPGSPLVKGLLWGTFLGFLAVTIGTSLMGFGFFASNTANPVAVVLGVMALHLLYGGVFGALTGKAKEEVTAAAVEPDVHQAA